MKTAVEEKAQDASEMPFSASFRISHEMIYRQVCGKSAHPGWPHGQAVTLTWSLGCRGGEPCLEGLKGSLRLLDLMIIFLLCI